jgi:hypothetical protein
MFSCEAYWGTCSCQLPILVMYFDLLAEQVSGKMHL